jgi:hypothetical protein
MTPNKSHGRFEPVELTLSKGLDFEPFYVAEPRLFAVTSAISRVTPM